MTSNDELEAFLADQSDAPVAAVTNDTSSSRNDDSGLIVPPPYMESLIREPLREINNGEFPQQSTSEVNVTDYSDSNMENIPPITHQSVNDLEPQQNNENGSDAEESGVDVTGTDDDGARTPDYTPLTFDYEWELTASEEEIELDSEDERSLLDCQNQIHYLTSRKILVMRKKDEMQKLQQQGQEAAVQTELKQVASTANSETQDPVVPASGCGESVDPVTPSTSRHL